MMHETLLIMVLSIFFTFIAFISANILIKKMRINHPKNRTLIHIFVILAASMIFIIPFTTLGFTNSIDDSPQNQIDEKKDSSSVIIIKDNLPTNYLTNDGKESIKNSIPKIQERINIMIEKLIKNSNDQEIGEVPFEIAPQNEYLYTKIINPNSKINKYYLYFKSNLKLEHNTDNNEFIYSTTGIENNNVDENRNINVFTFFWQFNIILILLSGIYLILSLSLGKSYLLKSMNAIKCTDQNIIKIVSKISDEFKIKMPKIFVYIGSPNAFVFTYPTTLVISQDLLNILSEDELKQAIRHEIAHIKNKDIILKPILQSIRILFFYNPFVHILSYKIMKERELLADSYRVNSKSQKVKYMDALIKIHEFTRIQKNSIFSNALYNAITMPLVSYHPKKLTITERFDNLFTEIVKKSAYTLVICIILLSSNLTLLTLTQNIIQNPAENIETNEDTYQIIYIIDNINPNYQSYQGIEYRNTATYSYLSQRSIKHESNNENNIPIYMYHISMNNNFLNIDHHFCKPYTHVNPTNSIVSF